MFGFCAQDKKKINKIRKSKNDRFLCFRSSVDQLLKLGSSYFIIFFSCFSLIDGCMFWTLYTPYAMHTTTRQHKEKKQSRRNRFM